MKMRLAILAAVLPCPLASLLDLAGAPAAVVAWAEPFVTFSKALFPGLRREIFILSLPMGGNEQLFDVLSAVSIWCLTACLLVACWAFLTGSGLALQNLRRSALHAKTPVRAGGRKFRCFLFWLLFAFCWAYALSSIFRSGGYFIDAHKTCSHYVGGGRSEHCVAYALLPLKLALWKLGWRASLGNLVLLALATMSWFGFAGAWAADRNSAESR